MQGQGVVVGVIVVTVTETEATENIEPGKVLSFPLAGFTYFRLLTVLDIC